MGEQAGPLAGQVAFVTGAGRGIGRALALGLAERGMAVGLLSRGRDALEDTLRACRRAGVKGVAVAADVTRPDAVREAVRSIERDLGPIDLLVNAAGQMDPSEGPLWESDPTRWWGVVETNLRGPYNTMRFVLPGMVARGHGRIVDLNSGFAGRREAVYTAYATSKAALLRLADNVAEELSGRGVTLLELSPGAVRTAMTERMSIFAGKQDWNDMETFVEVVALAAEGRLDALAGRFVHTMRDNLGEMLSGAERIRKDDARTLRLRPYGLDDPLNA